MRREPVAVINSVITVIEAGVALAVGFGLAWSAEQVALFMAFTVAVANVGKTVLVRSMVSPVKRG